MSTEIILRCAPCYSQSVGFLLSVLIVVTVFGFDHRVSNAKKSKIKKGLIPDYDKPARGTQPVRQHHKTDSSKILPHVRHCLQYDI